MRFPRLFVMVIALLYLVSFSFAVDVTTLEHGGNIQSAEFHPTDSSQIVSASDDNTIKLWDLDTNTATTFSGHTDKVNAVAFSPNGELLASGSDDKTFKLWNTLDESLIATLEHIPIEDQPASTVTSVAFAPDGNTLATAGYQTVKLWDLSDNTVSHTFEHDDWVWTVALSRDGSFLATDDGVGTTVKVWDVQQKQITKTLEGHTSDINFVKFSSDGRMLASSSWGGEIKLWAVSNWELLGTFHTHGTAAIDFSPDGETLVSGGFEEVTLWSVTSGEKIATLPGHTGWIRGVAFSADGITLISGGEGGKVRVQDIKSRLESTHPRKIVRLIYFLPSDRSPQPDIDEKFDKLIKDAQEIFAGQMDYYGFGRKTFQFETDATGMAVVHHVKGKFKDEYYHNQSGKVWEEIDAYYDRSTNIYLAALDTSTGSLDGFACGFGGPHGAFGGTVLIPASGWCFEEVDVTIHELGHAFGLQHDFRNNLQPWIDLYSTEPMTTSPCAAEWLDAHRYFNTDQPYFNETTTIEMLPPGLNGPKGRRLSFKITDLDGLHQAQLFITVEYLNGHDLSILDCQSLEGSSNIVEFVRTPLTLTADSEPLQVIDDSVTIRIIDAHGNFTQKEFPLHSPEDLNMDGTVNIQDLVLVASNFGATGQNIADVNEDGVVNIQDLILVAGGLNQDAAAPPVWASELEATPIRAEVQQWLREAKQVNLADPAFQRGILVLEQLLVSLTPKETTLMSNYPNPFNPETWIPYRLGKSTDVSISIYAMDGKLVRTLELGHQPLGIYESRSRAAYWDGRNELGEPVASGVYFYTLSAGDFNATRKMLIRK